MPNWCENYLEVSGPTDDLRCLRDTLDGDALQAGIETLDGRIEDRGTAVTVWYPTKWSPGLDAVSRLSAQFRSLKFTLIWYEFNMGLRGYVIHGPEGEYRGCYEENIDMYAAARMFPSNYPVPMGSEEWAATARSDDDCDTEGSATRQNLEVQQEQSASLSREEKARRRRMTLVRALENEWLLLRGHELVLGNGRRVKVPPDLIALLDDYFSGNGQRAAVVKKMTSFGNCMNELLCDIFPDPTDPLRDYLDDGDELVPDANTDRSRSNHKKD